MTRGFGTISARKIVIRLLCLSTIGGGSFFVPMAACSREPASRPVTTAAAQPSPTTASAPATTSGTTWARPRFVERQADRAQMVAEQIAASPDGRDPVRDARVLDAMRQVPRHRFVPAGRQTQAYDDHPLPIGHDQTISQPYIVALMTEALRVRPGDRILEIGTGSGYQAAVLAELTPHVYTIEIVKPLAEQAAATLRELGYGTVQCRAGDGYLGWPEAAPFDGIIVTCAADRPPPALWQQLRPGGRMVIPIGGAWHTQQLTILTKQPDGGRRTEVITPCVFVPMTGRIRTGG